MSMIPGSINNILTTESRTRNTSSQTNPEAVAPKPAQAAKVSNESSDSSVQLSETAQIVKDVQKELDSFPVVDENRVAELKAKISSGDYYPDGAKIANKIIMLENLIRDDQSE